MDAFYASVEQRDDPSLRGKPVAVAWRGARSVVCAASYEARVFGVRSAMPAIRAERLCPQLVFVPPDFARYKAVSRQIREIFAQHTDLIEPLSLDEAYLDVTVTKSGLPSATATAEAIRAAIREETRLTASAGVAPNKFLAKIASDFRKPDGLFVVRPHQVEAFLTPLPVGRLPGVGKVMEAKLALLGIATVGDLRAFARAELEQRFGRWGQRLHELSRGIDDHPVQPDRPTLQISAEDTFEHDLTLDDLEPHIRQLAGKAWAGYQHEREPRRAHRGAEAENRRLPHPDAQPHAHDAADVRRRTGRYRLRPARARRSPRRQPLPPGRRGPVRLHRRRQLPGAGGSVRLTVPAPEPGQALIQRHNSPHDGFLPYIRMPVR